MSKNLYPIHYLEVLKEIEKGEKSFTELREITKLDRNKLWRALTRLQLDGLIQKAGEGRNEKYRITEKGREYLKQLKELVMA
ncbi:ArsR family transcriptional regulator [Sulfolobus islandicus]|uniref:ArnR1-like winged helix-turn-helix domain-containing protein n=1 Tax=Saccharolobus islandicus (strain HVE10/4) TaxID=930943 RepID=F0NK02_SACI0|nr:winged helix-turn-helix domain-containing protein [Sulfolobus islandicus]ADX82318.1 conserved hypothetical protein [Sulfolobus islandicus HVE10/4]WCM36369.1 ArsR family transcriptional regulator [Sulfolobus islandicus]